MSGALNDDTAEDRFGHSVATEMDMLRQFLGGDS